MRNKLHNEPGVEFKCAYEDKAEQRSGVGFAEGWGYGCGWDANPGAPLSFNQAGYGVKVGSGSKFQQGRHVLGDCRSIGTCCQFGESY